MFSSSLLLIIKLCLFIDFTNSFPPPKQSLHHYFRTHNNVYMTNPKSHTTNYGIYVAGHTVTVDIPRSVAKLYDIIKWKVVNVDKNRLMFVYNGTANILINQQQIKIMEYSGKLSDSIIALGDNKALHVPTISNLYLNKPAIDWNYLELLHFDAQSEKVSVIRRLHWLKDDDWRHVIQWRMTDYMHFDNKLFLVIRRVILSVNTQSYNQELAIMRLCLDKDIEIISTAMELRIPVPISYDYIEESEAILTFYARTHASPTEPKDFYLFTTQHTPNNTVTFLYYFLGNLLGAFEQTIKSCAAGANNVTLLREHLRLEVGRCNITTYQTCLPNGNVVPSADIQSELTELSAVWQFDPFRFAKPQYIAIQYPYYFNILLFHLRPLAYSVPLAKDPHFMIIYTDFNGSIAYHSQKNFTFGGEYQFHKSMESVINKHPLGGFYVSRYDDEMIEFWNANADLCRKLKTCFHCAMYGLSIDCVWSNGVCTYSTSSSGNHTGKMPGESVVNQCFKIEKISHPPIKPSQPTPLTIELNENLQMANAHEKLVVKAGPNNHCMDVKINGKVIECSLMINGSDQFNIAVEFVNDMYADLYSLGAVSPFMVNNSITDKNNTGGTGFLSTVKSNSLALILILFVGLVLSTFLFVAYTKCGKKQSGKLEPYPGARNSAELAASQRLITPVAPPISPQMDTRTQINPAKSMEPSSKPVKSLKSNQSSKLGQAPNSKSKEQSVKSKNEMPSVKVVKSSKSKPMNKQGASAKPKKSKTTYSNQFPPLRSQSVVNKNMK